MKKEGATMANKLQIDMSMQAIIRDLAPNGCGVDTSIELEMGAEVSLTFVMPNGKSLKKMVAMT